MPEFYSLWTDTGLQKAGAAVTESQGFEMLTAVVGDGNGFAVTPNKGMTGLVNQVWSGHVGSKPRSKIDPNTIVYEFSIPAAVGPFIVREVGLKDASGALCIVSNFPETPKPVAADGSVRDMVLRIPVYFENAENVSLVVDPVATASNKDVDRKIAAHNEHGEAHQDIREEIADKTAQATDVTKGISAIATQDEVDAGESTIKMLVPARLKAWWDSVRTWGNIKDKPLVFPPAEHNHISEYQSGKNAYGWWEIFPDGTIHQGGNLGGFSGGTALNADVTFPIQFPAQCDTFVATVGVAAPDYDVHSTYRKSHQSISYGMPTHSGVEGQIFITDNFNNARKIHWFAKGK